MSKGISGSEGFGCQVNFVLPWITPSVASRLEQVLGLGYLPEYLHYSCILGFNSRFQDIVSLGRRRSSTNFVQCASRPNNIPIQLFHGSRCLPNTIIANSSLQFVDGWVHQENLKRTLAIDRRTSLPGPLASIWKAHVRHELHRLLPTSILPHLESKLVTPYFHEAPILKPGDTCTAWLCLWNLYALEYGDQL